MLGNFLSICCTDVKSVGTILQMLSVVHNSQAALIFIQKMLSPGACRRTWEGRSLDIPHPAGKCGPMDLPPGHQRRLRPRSILVKFWELTDKAESSNFEINFFSQF